MEASSALLSRRRQSVGVGGAGEVALRSAAAFSLVAEAIRLIHPSTQTWPMERAFSVAGSTVSGAQQPQQYPGAVSGRRSPKRLNEKKRDKTDEEILAIGRQLSDLARQSNEEDLRAAGKNRPSGLASAAAAITALRKSRRDGKKRGLSGSKKHRDSSSDESDWESASDDDGDSSESSSSDESALHLAYGGNESSRSNVALAGAAAAAAGAVAASAAESYQTAHRPIAHRRKSSVVDPRLFGPVNSLRGLVHTPCGFGDEQQLAPSSTGSGRHSLNRYDNDRPATGESQADSAHRPGSVPLQQPIPMVPVSNKVFEAGSRDSRNSYRRQRSNEESLDPTLGGGVAAAAAAAAARMADRRGPWTEDRIYRDDVKRTRPDADEDYFQRDQAPFEEIERRRANPEVYYNRRNDDVDSPRSEATRQMPDYFNQDAPGMSKESRSWMELHPQERKETLRYQTTHDVHVERREAELREAQRQQEREQQQQQQQSTRTTKAGDGNIERPTQPASDSDIDPFKYQVADDAFSTPQFNTPRRPLTPQVVTVERVPNFTESSQPPSSGRQQSRPDIRLSRKDTYDIQMAEEERRRGNDSGSRHRDPRDSHGYEEEEREARSILDEAKRSTIPVAAVAVASAIAVEEERSRERRRRDYSDDGSRDRSRPHKDVVQEEADKYYRESVIARKIASDEIRSQSKSPDGSVVDKWDTPPVEEHITIVTPPNMEGKEHEDDDPYGAPNADVKIDNEIFPYETDKFRAAKGSDAPRFRSKDPSCERERPLLNIVRPTPVPSPDSTAAARREPEQPTEIPASRDIHEEESLADSSEDEEAESKGEATHSSPTGKSVSWGQNEINRFVVESPEARSRAESPNELAEAEEKPRPRLSKSSRWGKIAAVIAAGTAEPISELDRNTEPGSRDLPADASAPGSDIPDPEPEQMPGSFDDEEFAATVAAGLEKTGFNPNIVIDDPAFRRRNSRPETNETPLPASDTQRDEQRAREEIEVEGDLSLTDTEDEHDEKTQKQKKVKALERYLQMRQSGEIKPPSQLQESDQPPTVEERPVTPPQKSNSEQRKVLEAFLQKRQSGEIKPPREILEARESRELEPAPEAKTGPVHESDTERPPIRKLEPEALRELEENASDFEPPIQSKKKKKKKRRGPDDENSKLSIPGDEATEISRISVPGDEATVFSVEDWEDWDSSPGASTRRSLLAGSEMSTSSRRSTRLRRPRSSTFDLPETNGSEHPGDEREDDRGMSSVVSEPHDEERKPRSRESKSLRHNDNSEKHVSSRKPRKVSGNKKPGLFSGMFNKPGGKNDRTEVVDEKRSSFFEQADTLGAGVGPASLAAAAAMALNRSNAADVSSEPENISRELSGSNQEFNDHYPVIAPRAIAIDPQYRDLLPLPPSEPGSPVESDFGELPGLPDSRPTSPIEGRDRRFDKVHRRQRSNQDLAASARNRSHSNTAVPLAALLRGIGSGPPSPVANKPPRTPPRPTSWDSTKEFMPLMLLEHSRRGSLDRSVKSEELPPLPPSEVTSEAEGGDGEDFRTPMPYPDDDFRLRLQTEGLPAERAVASGESEGSTPKADLAFELPAGPTDNDRRFNDDYESAPVKSTSSSGQSARTVDAQAIPSPTTPTRRRSPQKDAYLRPDELTSADASDDFETARTSPADVHDEDLYEPPLIEPSMLGAIPEFSRPAKFFEDKVPDHSALATMDRVIETLPSNESVPEDQTRQGSRNYPDLQSEAAQELPDKGKKSISSDERGLYMQPSAEETAASFVEVPEISFNKGFGPDVKCIPSTESLSKDLTEDKALAPEMIPKPVAVEDELELETRTLEPEFESIAEEISVFEPLDEDVEAPYTEPVDIIPVSDEILSDPLAESTQRSQPEEVEEIIVGTIPKAAPHSAPEAPVQEYPKKPDVSTVIEDSDDSEEEEESDEEEDSDDSEDSEDSDEEEDEELGHLEIAKRVDEDGNAIRDMTASIDSLGAASVISSSSKKKKKKNKKKKKKKRKKKKKSKTAAAAAAAATAAALAAAEASTDTNAEPATETTEPTVAPVVDSVTETTPSELHNPPTELGRSEVEPTIGPSIEPTPADAMEVTEETPLDVAKDFVASESATEAPEKTSREVAEESTTEKTQGDAVTAEPETTTLAETEERRDIPSGVVENASEEADELAKWAATDSEPIPHSDHRGERESSPVEDKATVVEELIETLLPSQEETSAPADVESQPTSEELAGGSAGQEHHDADVEDRDALVADVVLPTEEETPINPPAVTDELVAPETEDSHTSHADELASVPQDASPAVDREWAGDEIKEQDSEEVVADQDFEQTSPFELPTIMEEPLEDASATESDDFEKTEQDAPTYSDQLSPILEETMEDLLEESAPAEMSEPVSLGEDVESKPEPVEDKLIYEIDQTEDRPDTEDAGETKDLEPSFEQPEATTAIEDVVSAEPKMDETSRSIDEVAEPVGEKDTDRPPQLPSFASDISEPLFTQGDAPTEYPTQQSPSYEPTQMDESFIIPEESARLPTEEQTESTEAVKAPSVLDTVDELETEAEENKERSADANDIVPSEEAKDIHEQESTETPDLGLPEPELKEADSPAEEENNDEKQESSISHLEPAEQTLEPAEQTLEPTEQAIEPTEGELEPEITPNESVEIPSLTDHQTPADTMPETRELASADESREAENPVLNDSAPDADLAEVAPEESSQDNAAIEQPSDPVLELDVVPPADKTELGSPILKELETKDEDSVPLKESETLPPQEVDENADLEPKPDQEASDDGLKPPVDNTVLETEKTGDQSREADADAAKPDIPLETGPAEDSRSTHEEELQTEVEGNDYGNVDGQTEEEKANDSEQSVEVVDSTNTLDAAVETNLPQESNMTSELEQPTLEAELEASPITLPNVDEEMERERLTQDAESGHLDLAQDGAIAPVSTVPETAIEEVERAPEAKDASTEAGELRAKESLELQEGKPQVDAEMTEPTSDGQERSVAENLSQIETPAEGVRDDTVDTTLIDSGLATNTSYIPLLDKEEELPGKILSHPLDIFESDIPDAPNPINVAVEDAEAEAADKNLTEEKEKPSKEQILSHPLDIFESDIHNTPNPIDITAEDAEAEAADKDLIEEKEKPSKEQILSHPLDLFESDIHNTPNPIDLAVDDAEAAEKGLTEEKSSEERAVTEDEPQSKDLQPESVQAEERQPESRELQEAIPQVDEATQQNTTTEEASVDPILQKDEAEPAAELEQLPPAEAISQPSEEQPTERVRLPEFTFPAKPAQGSSRRLTEDSIDPLDPVPQRPSSSYRQEIPPRKSTFLLAPPEPDYGETSASEYGDSDDDSDSDNDTSTIISDTASLRGSIRRSRHPRHSESTSSLTGFEVTAVPYAEQHAHRATRSKKKKGKKKKQKHKHKRKKSTAGSEPSSSHNSLGEQTGQGDGANNNPPPPHPEREAPPPPPQREAPLPPGEISVSEPTTALPEALEKVESEPRELVRSDSAENKFSESAKNGDASLAPILEEVVAEEPANADSKLANEPESANRDAPSTAAPAPLGDESENPWDLFTNKWEKHGSATQSQEELAEGHIIEDAPFVDEPSAISTPQRRSSQTEQQIMAGNVDNAVEPSSEEHGDKQDPSVSSPSSSMERGVRPSSASSQGSERSGRPWFTGISGSVSLMAERFGGAKKKPTRDIDKDPIPPDRDPIPSDKEDPKDQSFLGNPAPRKSGDERSWQLNQVQTIDDFLESGNGPTTPNKRKKRQSQSIRPSTPKRSESISEVISPELGGKKLRRRDAFKGERVGSADIEEATELLESLGPFELLRRSSQVGDPIGGLLREANASEISVLPPMELGEFSDYETSDYRLSPPRTLPSVEELPEPEAEAEATASEVGFYRDSDFSEILSSRSRRHSTSTIPIGDDEEKMRDSGVDGDWIEAAIAKLKTPEPVNKAPDRPLKRRLRRSTLGGQRLGETSLRDAAQDPEKKTIPGTRERVLTGTGTRPETPTGRSSPTRKGYGAIAGMGIAPRRLSTISPIPSLSDRSDTPPMLRRAATSFSFSPMTGPPPTGPSPPVAGPLRSLRRAVSAQIAPGLQRPESPALKAISTEPQPRSVSDSQIPSATRHQPDPARADPSNGPAPQSPPNSGAVRQRTPERRKLSLQADAVSGSTVRSSSIPTPGLRRADKRGGDLRSLRQQNSSSASLPVANEGRVRAKDKTDVFDGLGEGQFGSPRSPTRPHSMRRRQSMQVLELEARVEQLIAENRLLSDARHSSEQHLSHRVVTALSDRDTQIEALNQRLKFLKGEVSRLTEVNEGLTSANAELANKDNSRYADLQVYADRDGNEAALMQALHEKDAQIADLTTKLDAAKERIRELQRQILESKAADVQFLNIKDEDYFDHRCQQLCSHVQQWVLRFSKFSDMRACRLTNEINDEKIIDRLDNAVLDGSDVDRYLNDRVRRRDIFMSMTMNMIWEFVFTRYLFGMDREQRQKLKSLEKLLTEVGPAQAVRQWRAVTLTLLSKRDSFKRQRDLDTEAVVQAIYQTLCKVLPPPSNLEGQIQAQLRRVMHEAVHLSIEMRTQKAEYMMLPPLQPEYDADGELVQTVQFNASMMSERSGTLKLTNEELEARGAIVRVVLFPLVVKKGDDDGSNDEEIVISPAQVLIARSKLTRQPTPSDGGRASTGTGRLSGGTNSPDTRQANAV
ncbi:hypothetical protein TGAM01_v207289 [Trichoderma gamsii]|uniref:Involucrin repeat protein n=2 Tax=Trichoderma gamsii TaxID=398673 RepID=A0A2P4ZI46_9HYPO|nr:hypothetical protein TGAM01_v207289 [Trichoderma gamsii]PON23961.1 hypothetical protein TGAM01_v207289 [Trichoderma gamsii]